MKQLCSPPKTPTLPNYQTSDLTRRTKRKDYKIHIRPDGKLAPGSLRKISPQFITFLAHEVRNPLTNINLSIEMLKSSGIDSNGELYLDIIKRSSARINDLINELLISHVEEELKVEKYSLHNLLEEAIEMAKDNITLKGISVHRNYADKDCEILLNKSQMKIALANIIINAIDAMLPGSGELKLTSKTIGGGKLVTIEDNGCGISPGNLELISQPFYTNRPGGMGIGLATSYAILKVHRVAIDVESEVGIGTRFNLLFDGAAEVP